MRNFTSFTQRRRQRREALHNVFRTIGEASPFLTPTQAETLLKSATAMWATGEIMDIVNRHVSTESFRNPRERR